jgi:hypothetical protein
MTESDKPEVFVLCDRSTHSIPSPFWFSVASIARGRVIGLNSDRTVRFGRDNFTVRSSELSVGEAVRVWFDAEQCRVLCCREHDYQRSLLANSRTQPVDPQPVVESVSIAETAWRDRFNPPFRWALGHKLVYAGLTERSAGNGLNRNSVEHIMLLEPYASGRLVRKAGDMLCSAIGGSYGNESHVFHQTTEPSCKACLAIGARFLVAEPAAEQVDERLSWGP